jgi:pSer/pThr/pTyr-binding forkhead associated (FHA) protein
MAILTLVFGRDVLQTFDINGKRMIIGRAEDCTIVVDNLAVSRHHAIIEKKDDQYLVNDLDSNNGTFVNGRRITEPTALNFGDEIGIGKHVLLFDSHTKKEGLPTICLFKEAVPDMDSPERGTMFVDPEKMEKIQKKVTAYRKAHLLVKGSKTQIIPLEKKDIVFGKAPDCDIRVKGFFCSRRHAVLSRLDSGFQLANLAVLSPVRLNGLPVESAFVCDGDEIKIGKNAFIFHSSQ